MDAAPFATPGPKIPARRLRSTLVWTALLAAWLLALPAACADDLANSPAAGAYDYASPRLLTGTLYALGSHRTKVLFTFRRTATRAGDTVNVRRQFLAPNGSVAAEEDVVYNAGRLASLQMHEFQAGVSGALQIVPDAKHPGRQDLVIGFSRGSKPSKPVTQSLPPDTVVDDTLYPFLRAHWDDLMRGRAVKFHFVSLEWERTFVFRLVRTGETVQDGRTVEQIKMQPANFFVAELVRPLVFAVEKDSPHRILSYTGRTTPRLRKGKAWKYLDAETVFNW